MVTEQVLNTGLVVAQTPSTMEIMREAVKQLGGEGAVSAVAALKELVGLQREEEDRQARRAFAAAFSRFRALCPVIPRDRVADMVTRKGSRRTQRYADLATIEAKIRGPLFAEGFSYRWDSEPDPDRRCVKVTCFLLHASGHEATATVVVPVDPEAPMNDTQRHGSAYTYGQRYSLVQVLGLSTADDTDGTPPEQLAPIAEEQANELERLLAQLKAPEDARGKFLAWLKVGSLAEIPAGRYEEARSQLLSKIRKESGA